MMLDENLCFLNSAAMAPLPQNSYNILKKYDSGQMKRGFLSLDVWNMDEHWQYARQEIAGMINGSKEGVVLTHNTEQGIHIVIDGLYSKLRPGTNIVISELEFTTNSYVFQQICSRYGLELRTLEFNNGFSRDEMERKIDDQTVLVSISFVQYLNGYRINLKDLCDVAKSHGAYVLLDAIQGIGCVPFDISKYEIDFISAGGQKWMMGPLGTGFFYVNPKTITDLETVLVGWISSKDYMNMKHHPFAPWDDARKFQQTFNFKSLALVESIRLLKSWNIQRGFDHIRSILDYLKDRISEFDYLRFESDFLDINKSGFVKIGITLGDVADLGSFLKNRNISITAREQGIRVAPHVFNDKSDIDRLLEEVNNWIKFQN